MLTHGFVRGTGMTGIVKVSEVDCYSGHRIGILTLDNTAALNALTLTMLQTIQHQLLLWREDDKIISVVIHAAEKHFSAGGDIKALYHAMNDDPSIFTEYDTEFSSTDIYLQRLHNDNSILATAFFTDYFSAEYYCCYLIHHYPKPIITLGQGMIMGGGLGLFMGASHRVMTPDAILAMPEMNIGLYPDAGASWFLNQLPDGIGLFLGLTASKVNASDAVDLGMTKHIIAVDDHNNLIQLLKNYPWDHRYTDVSALISKMLTQLQVPKEQYPASEVMPYFAQIQAATIGDDLNDVYQQILAIDGFGYWLEQAKTTLITGSPIAAHICFQQLHQCQHMTLAECLKIELALSVRCGLLGEFHEGIRARLIDKDHQPQWLYRSMDEVDRRVIDDLFMPFWHSKENPMMALYSL